MNKLTIDNYINLKYKIKDILNDITVNNNCIYNFINEIKELLLENNYKCLEEAILLYDYVCNKSTTNNEQLIILLENLYYSLLVNYKISVYFYGNDSFKLFDYKNTKFDIKSIDKINDDKNFYKILIKEDKLFNHSNYYFDIIYNYYDIIDSFLSVKENTYDNIYINSYYYLKYELARCKREIFDTLVVGISYSVRGIIKSNLSKKSLALYMNSQDLYYSYKMARQAILFNKGIRKCIIGISYYSFFYDMSKSRMKLYTNIIYKYILNDLHNYKNDNNIYFQNPHEEYFDMSIYDIVLKDIFMMNNVQENIFFNCYNDYQNLINENISKIIDESNNYQVFSELDLSEKTSKGEYYANLHNKHFKHKETRSENYSIFMDFIDFLITENVEPIIVVFPSTYYYNKNLKEDYKKDFYNIIDSIKKYNKIKFIDLNDYDVFDDTDFYDESHLNEKGAHKSTSIINQLIY